MLSELNAHCFGIPCTFFPYSDFRVLWMVFFSGKNKQPFYLYFFAYKFIGCARDRRTIMSWIITWWNLRCCKLTQIDVKIVTFYIWSFQQHILNFYFHHFQYFSRSNLGHFFVVKKIYIRHFSIKYIHPVRKCLCQIPTTTRSNHVHCGVHSYLEQVDWVIIQEK